MTARMMHLAVEASLWHTDGRWRLPGTFTREEYFTDPRLWVEMAKTAERGKMDLIFWGEGYGIGSTYEASPDAAIRWGVQWPRHDMSTMIPILAWETKHLGFVQTLSTSFTHPFHVARFAASMDHVTQGRFGLNLINSARTSDFENFGLAELPSHEDRYERMDEFVRVCRALWDSVSPEAIILDPESGIFADPAHVHPIDHDGRFFNVAGPLPVLPSPQGRPLLVQAGGSNAGNAFAGKNVDVQYASAGAAEGAWKAMQAQRSKLDAATEAAGRRAESVKLLFDASPVIGSTSTDAQYALAAMRNVISPEAALAYLSHNLTFDFSVLPDRFSFGEIVRRSEDRGGSRGGPLHALEAKYGAQRVDRSVLVDEARSFIVPGDCVGTAEFVADRLESLYERGGGDGFALHLRPSITASVAAFVDGVIPILQSRGVFRRDYGEAATLRQMVAEP